MSDVAALEHATLKVPYEILNKKFRLAQKAVDREAEGVRKAGLGPVERVLSGEKVLAGELLAAVQGLETRLEGLESKASAAVAEEAAAAGAIRRRLAHLTTERAALGEAEWGRQRVDRLLIEYLLRAGYYASASALAQTSGLDYLANLSVFLTAQEVEESLGKGELGRALDWCHDNRSKLRRLSSRLELHLREQEFIELLRSDKRSEAVAYAQAHFRDLSEKVWKDELGAIVALVAFPASTSVARYAELFSARRWAALRQEFVAENFRLYQLAHESVFSACLESGLSALKTPECREGGREEDAAVSAAGCPVCAPEVFLLSRSLPFAHASHSRLVCAASGDAIDEHNPPLMLPNGFVYGRNFLQEAAARHDGRIFCPRTAQLFSAQDPQRLFIM